MPPSLPFLHAGQANQQASHTTSQQQASSMQAGKSVSQNRLQIWPLQVSQPPPASRGAVAVGADPGSEISITLGTDCTATTVPYHTGSREILPFRTRAAVCHLYAALHTTAMQVCKQHAPRLGPPGRPGHTCQGTAGHRRQAGRQASKGERTTGHGHDHGHGSR